MSRRWRGGWGFRKVRICICNMVLLNFQCFYTNFRSKPCADEARVTGTNVLLTGLIQCTFLVTVVTVEHSQIHPRQTGPHRSPPDQLWSRPALTIGRESIKSQRCHRLHDAVQAATGNRDGYVYRKQLKHHVDWIRKKSPNRYLPQISLPFLVVWQAFYFVE